MDIADQATHQSEMLLAAAIQAARGVPSPPRPRSVCGECGDELHAHRLAYGLCLECASAIEAQSLLRSR